ncbi:MAG: TIR domain-containing protein [Ruminococcaceae bacterium]|nr:TIR domain-containing protein [Oscillospiraceae bacterium]
MAVFKCKMCGAPLELVENMTVTTCDHCGVQQTLPRLTDEKRERLYDRANHFRRNDDFDKAAGIYEQILAEDDHDAEAYWSLVLCRYGIEYVEDPQTHKRVPTVNRTQFTSIYDDDNYRSAIENADSEQRRIYEEEAATINEIQKGILAISQKEEPFDVFICYKESDSNGRRTRDSVLAQELYHELCEEGFKVFFARITLEDKLGIAYEPYIFAALNSAKVMVVLGTQAEYFNAVWVKNEWSRYLTMIKNGAKKMLIPAYKDMDPYDLPEEFSHLQAQDMSKLGFMQDLVRGIGKIVEKEEPKSAAFAASAVSPHALAAPLLTRTKIFMDNGDWENASIKCEAALDIEPENAKAYIYQTMIALCVSEEAELENSDVPLEQIDSFRNALMYADEATAQRLTDYNRKVKERLAKAEAERAQALSAAQSTSTPTFELHYSETSQTPVETGASNKRKREYFLLGLFFLFPFWPLALYFFYKWYRS